MPCNGIAVANGQINMNIAKLIFSIPPDDLKQTIAAMLKKQFPQLAKAKVKNLPWRGDLGFKIGRFLFEIQKNGQVTVSATRSQVDDSKTTQEMQEAVSNLLTGLAGIIIQNQITSQIKNAGYKITNKTHASNGAIVLNVEI